MWATWLTPAGANLFTEPRATFTNCLVQINNSVWPSWRTDDYNFPAFRKDMLHEHGHFEGYSDVGAAAGTIQYERADRACVPLCEKYRLIYGRTIYAYQSSPLHRLARKPRRPHAARPHAG